MKLPYLKNRKIPRIATSPPEEKHVGPEGDVMAEGPDDLINQVASEFMKAVHANDPSMMREALKALVMDIQNQDQEQDEAMEGSE